MWVENSSLNDSIPPSKEELSKWVDELKQSHNLKKEVWMRYVITCTPKDKFKRWMKRNWFFSNATENQLQEIHDCILDH